MKPAGWICAALSVGEAAKNFKLLSVKTAARNPTQIVRVLHKETGAIWSFECRVERDGAK